MQNNSQMVTGSTQMEDLNMEKEAQHIEPKTKVSLMKRFTPLAVILGLMGFAYAMGWHKFFTLSALIQHRADLASYVNENLFISLLTFAGLYIVAVALSFPGASLLTIAGGFFFGWLIGGSITILAATIGASIIFMAARTSFGSILQEKAGKSVAKLADGFKEDAFNYLLFLRLVPVFPFWLINIAPALFNVRLPSYFAATFIGIAPGTFAYAFLGEGLDSIIAAQEAANPGCGAAGTCSIDLKAAITPEIIGAMIALIFVALIPIVLKAWKKRKAQ
jgi:uncharacterized membrane protein YdjX (TVP38/TMEM64 family)